MLYPLSYEGGESAYERACSGLGYDRGPAEWRDNGRHLGMSVVPSSEPAR